MRVFPFSRFVVHDRSMLPAYQPGDRVLTFDWVRPKVGDVIVFEKVKVKYLKRVSKIKNDLVYVRSENQKEGSQMEPVNLKNIIGRVVFKY